MSGERKVVEGRTGVKIGYLAIIIAIPTTVVKLISIALSIWNSWITTDISLQFGLILIIPFGFILIGMLTYYTIQALRKPELIEEQYKFPGWGIVVGLSFCISIVLAFAFLEQFIFGDVITTSVFFLIGILFIISGIIMVQEVKGETEQIQAE